MESLMFPCLFKSVFGIPCFGCGAQRSLLFLAQGKFSDAFQMFPAIYSTLLLFALIGLHLVDKSRNYQRIIIFVAVSNAIMMVVSYFYRIYF
jgi:Co/Zn/Cd efflux system component